MYYPFLCPCGATVTLKRVIADRDAPAFCTACGSGMKRQLVMPQLITQPFLFLPENRRPFGLSDSDLLAQARKDDKEYERRNVLSIPKLNDPGDDGED